MDLACTGIGLWFAELATGTIRLWRFENGLEMVELGGSLVVKAIGIVAGNLDAGNLRLRRWR